MFPPDFLAAWTTFVLPSWIGWALLAGAVLFLIGLCLALVVIARGSQWPRQR
jgi:hypothetical protein